MWPKFRGFTDRLSSMSQMRAMVLTVIILALVTGGVYLYSLTVNNRSKENITPTPTLTPTQTEEKPAEALEPTETPEVIYWKPTPTKAKTNTNNAATTPTIDCIGPDGKHLNISQQQCDEFNKAWATATPTPTLTPIITPTISPTPPETPSISPSNTPAITQS